MSTPSVLDLARLLTPLDGEFKCGAELRYDPLFDKLKDARTRRDSDPLAGSVEEADWKFVFDQASKALAERSKDLMLAAWLVESATALHGFAGLRDGLHLLSGLLREFWDGLYPLPDDGDVEPRLAPLLWLMDADRGARLPNRLRELPLVPGGDRPLSWTYWKSRYASPKGENEDDEVFSRRRAEADERSQKFETAVGQAKVEGLATVHADIRSALAAVDEIDRVATERFGRLAPSATSFRQALSECEVLVRQLVRQKGGRLEGDAEDAAADEAPSNGAPATPSASSGPVKSREDAFRRLAEVAAFLRRTEPQSPVPLLIDRAIVWGRMPFDHLLREMIKDDVARRQVNELLGIGESSES